LVKNAPIDLQEIIMRNVLTTVLAFAAVAAFAAPASAEQIFIDGIPHEQASTVIDIRGLDAGQVERRIARAARIVCGDAETRSIAVASRIIACRSAAVADARDQLASVPGSVNVLVAAIY
jgi:UrcA family protein